MKSIFIIFLLFVEASLAQSSCTASEAQGLRQCWLDYLNHFGYQTVPPNDDYVGKDITYLSANGAAGFQNQCDWVKTRYSCEQPYFPDCQNPDGYSMALNDSGSDATKYLNTDAVELWECTDGYNLTMNNYYCIISVNSNHFLEIEYCQLKLFNDLQNSTGCGPVMDYVGCIMGIYKNYCGHQGQIFGCHWAEIPMAMDFPACASSLPNCGDSKMTV